MTYINGVRGVISTNNKFPTTAAPETTTIASGATYSGTGDDVSNYSEIVVFVYSTLDSEGSGLSLEFSTDNSNWDKTIKYTIEKGLSRTLSTPVFAQYFRVIYTNGTVGTTTLRLQVIYHTTKSITSLNEAGNINVNVSNNTSSFGELYGVQLRPMVEMDFIYGINSNQVNTVIKGSGSEVVASTTNRSHLEITAGSSDNSSAQLSSIDIANYRPGQGVDIRFTAIFDTPINNSEQIIGVGSEDDGYFFGYNGSNFGLLKRFGGKRRIEKIIFSGVASATDTVELTLDDVTTDIKITTGLNLPNTAYEFSNGGVEPSINFADFGEGWETRVNGNSVYFIALTAGVRNGAYNYDHRDSGLTAQLSTDLSGNPASDVWILSTSWNVDKADGASILPAIDFQKGNVYRITYQSLGYGSINYYIENPINGLFQLVHQIGYSNTETNASIANPKQSLYIKSKKKTGASTDLVTMKVPSMCALLSGNYPRNYSTRNLYTRSLSLSLNADTENSIITFRNKLVYNSIQSTAKIILQSFSLTNTSSNIMLLKLYKNAVIDKGTPGVTWTDISTNSIIQYSEVQAALVSGTGIQIYGVNINKTETYFNNLFDFNISIYPGETLTITLTNLENSSITNAITVVTLNWVEDI